jgi:hypothetical protein
MHRQAADAETEPMVVTNTSIRSTSNHLIPIAEALRQAFCALYGK